MRIRIDGSERIEGELLAWSTTVIRWDGQTYPCPAAIVKTDRAGIRVVGLSDVFQTLRIDVMPDAEPPYRPSQPEPIPIGGKWPWWLGGKR
jgi:hypothetical protein